MNTGSQFRFKAFRSGTQKCVDQDNEQTTSWYKKSNKLVKLEEGLGKRGVKAKGMRGKGRKGSGTIICTRR
jgi:hypothetical protein